MSRFESELRTLGDGIAALTDPKRHAYCPLFWCDTGAEATHIQFPGPCGKCGQLNTEHVIDREYMKWLLRTPKRDAA